MAPKKFYVFTFADGYRIWSAALSRNELSAEERTHGKLKSKEPA